MFFWGVKSEEKEKKAFSLEMNSLKLKEQFEQQVSILSKAGILEVMPDKSLGIVGIDNKNYSLPTFEQIYKRFEDKKDLIEKKIKQGFVKVILVPFACPIEKIATKYEELLLNHYKTGNLFATKNDPNEAETRIDLDINNPVNIWDDCKNGDVKNTLVYFPEKYDRIYHKGKTKLEMLGEEKNAWIVFLLEDLPNLPSIGKGKKIVHRKQIETGISPVKYLSLLKKDMYSGETGLTPEVDLIYAITKLEETNQIINDWQGNGNVSYEIGALIVSSDSIPWLAWNRDFKRADLWKFHIENIDAHTGARVGIRV